MRLVGSSFVLVVLILVAGCARESEEDFLLKNAVRKYNRALVETYRMVDPELLADVAGEQEVRKVDVLITTLQMQNKVLRANLDRIRFLGIEWPGEWQAVVKTSEDWTYEHEDRKTRQRLGPAKRIHYELIYSLERRQGKWIVAGLRHDRERRPDSGLGGMLAQPGFLGTRAPLLPDVGLVGLLALIPCGGTALWFRRIDRTSSARWAVVGGCGALLSAGVARAIQGLLAGPSEARDALSPFLLSLAGALGWLVPAALTLAVVGGVATLYGLFRDRARADPPPLRIAALAAWTAALIAGVAQYWLLYVA